MIYDPQFKPILEVGHTVLLKGSAFKPEGKNCRCLAIDALPEYIKDFGSLTAATWSTDNEDTNLEVAKMELVQLRMMVLDDIKIKLKNPAPVSKWRTASEGFYLPQFPSGSGEDFLKELLFRQSEFFSWENDTPRFDLYSVATATIARIKFTGWKFRMEEIVEKGQFTLRVNG